MSGIQIFSVMRVMNQKKKDFVMLKEFSLYSYSVRGSMTVLVC